MTRTSQVSRKSTVAMANCLAAVSPSVSMQDTLKMADFCGFLIGVSQSVSLSCLGGAAGVSTVSVSLDRDSETARENGTFLRVSSICLWEATVSLENGTIWPSTPPGAARANVWNRSTRHEGSHMR